MLYWLHATSRVAMPILSEQEARAVVGPHLGTLDGIYRDAFAQWLKNPCAARMQSKTVRANVIWNDAVSQAKVKFDGVAGVSFEKFGRWQGLLFDNHIFVRLKKGSERLLSRNVRTGAAQAFHNQNLDLFGGCARLELLYVLSDDETEIERIVLVQRHMRKIIWAIDAVGGDDAQQVFPFAPSPTGSGGSVADRVIKPRINGEKENGTQRGTATGGGIST